jgi:uracil-DNA glycosylase
LGATAAFALTDSAAPLGKRRGRVETGLHDGPVLLSWHPSYILRLTDAAQQQRAREELAEDLATALAMASAA